MCVVDCRGGVFDWFEVPFPRRAGEDERPFWAALGGCGGFGAVSLPFPLALSLFLALWRRSSLCASLAAAGLRRGNEVFGSGRWSGKEFALGGRFDVPFWFAWSSPVSGSFIGWDCGGKLLGWSCCGACKVIIGDDALASLLGFQLAKGFRMCAQYASSFSTPAPCCGAGGGERGFGPVMVTCGDTGGRIVVGKFLGWKGSFGA